MRTTATQQATSSAPNSQDPTAYYAQFWEYTKYYGEAKAREFYKEWSPPAGTPNPNGGGGAPASAPAPAAQGGASESSQRNGVSNLPAWMTNAEAPAPAADPAADALAAALATPGAPVPPAPGT